MTGNDGKMRELAGNDGDLPGGGPYFVPIPDITGHIPDINVYITDITVPIPWHHWGM